MSDQLIQPPLIEVKDLNKHYSLGEQSLHVLRDINMSINSGEFVSVMGPSGSGKSTLINVLGFLDNHFEGDYIFNGQSVSDRNDNQISHLRNKMVGFVFQDFNLINNMTVRENVQLPLIYAGMTAKTSKARVEEVLDKVGLSDKLNSKPHELSGGQRQRVAIARALVNEPQFIIADEPTGALDTKTSQAIMDILSDLHQKEQVTIVMVTHDPSLQRYANKHIVIIDGQVREVELGEAQTLIHEFSQIGQEDQSSEERDSHEDE